MQELPVSSALDDHESEEFHGLAEDLIILSIRGDGKMVRWNQIRLGIVGAELIRLAAHRRIRVERRRLLWYVSGAIHLVDDTATGDSNLDRHLRALVGHAATPPSLGSWIGHYDRDEIRDSYMQRLCDTGVLRRERNEARSWPFRRTRWPILATSRATRAHARLDAALDAGDHASPEQTSLAGLASAIKLHEHLYRPQTTLWGKVAGQIEYVARPSTFDKPSERRRSRLEKTARAKPTGAADDNRLRDAIHLIVRAVDAERYELESGD